MQAKVRGGSPGGRSETKGGRVREIPGYRTPEVFENFWSTFCIVVRFRQENVLLSLIIGGQRYSLNPRL